MLRCDRLVGTESRLGRYLRKELTKVVRNDRGVRIVGPYRPTGPDDTKLKRIQSFRREQYLFENPHLLDQTQKEIERKTMIDVRALHYFAEYRNEIVATLRVVPPPFEMTELSDALREAVAHYPEFLELGRLIVRDDVRGLGLGKKLCYKAMLFSSQDYEGFIAICRETRSPDFKRFGLEPYQQKLYAIPSRPESKYHLMWANWNMLIWRTAKHYGRKRLKNYFSGNKTKKRLPKLRKEQPNGRSKKSRKVRCHPYPGVGHFAEKFTLCTCH